MKPFKQNSKSIKVIDETTLFACVSEETAHYADYRLPKSKPVDHEFSSWVSEKFPIALHCNLNLEYSEKEIKEATECFREKELKLFDNQPHIIKATACLIRSIRNNMNLAGHSISSGNSKKNKEKINDKANLPEHIQKVINSDAPVAKQYKKIMNAHSKHKEKTGDEQQRITLKHLRTTLTNQTAGELCKTLISLATKPAKNFPFVIIGNLLNTSGLLIDNPFQGAHDTSRIKIMCQRAFL